MRKAESAGRGRPPSAAARAAILAAARALIDEGGPANLTMAGVARRAKVGKPTVYRHFATLDALAMAALLAPDTDAAGPGATGIASLGPLLADAVARLNSRRGRHMASMLAGAEPDSELFKSFANSVMLHSRRQAAEAVRAGDTDADPGVLADMALGALFLRLLLRHAPLDDAFVAEVECLARRAAKG